jgi:beta propeller repeat protein
MYDLSTGQETPITTAPYYQFLSDFDGNRIAWLDSRNAGAKAIYEIYTYDLSTGQEMRIPVNVTYSLWDPAVYGDKIVWYDYRSSSNYANIYMYDFSTGKETQIDANAAFQWDPDIYENKIVWVDARNVGYGGDIYMATIS